MSIEEIERKHGLLVEGYEGMLAEGKIKYHTQITLQAIIEELQELMSHKDPVTDTYLYCAGRVASLQKLIDNQ